MKIKFILQQISIWLYVFMIAIVVGATVYQMMVIIPEFNRDFPNGMIGLAHSNIIPGKFWGSPFFGIGLLVLPIIALIANWKTPRRKWLLLAFGFTIAASVFTMVYFVPRLKIMGLLDGNPATDLSLLRLSIKQWIAGDKIRFWFVVVPGFLCALKASGISLTESRKIISDKVPANSSYAINA